MFNGKTQSSLSGRQYNRYGQRSRGYPQHGQRLSAFRRVEFPRGETELRYRLFDLGISGDRVRDLRARWQSDCLDLRPDVLSVLIGINDTWRRYDSGDPSDTEEFERVYRSLLEDARRENPSLKIIIMEPFVLHVSEERASWREDLDPRIQAVRRVAKDYADAFIPLDGLLNAAAVDTCPEQWAPDGVHPSFDGAALIARYWLEAFDKIL